MSTNDNASSERYGLPLSRTLRLLIAEDSPAEAEPVVAVLERAGYPLMFQVVSAPAEFEERLRTDDFDLVLTDHNLISWTGMDALEILRRTGKDVPFIVVTATLGDEAAVEYLKHGATDYVLKHRLERLPVIISQTLREQENRRQKHALLETIQCAIKEWELTFDSVPDAIFLTDGECNIRRANRAATQMLGRPFSEIIGRPCPELLKGLCKPTPECRQIDRMAAPVEGVQGSGNERVFEASSVSLRDGSGMLKGCLHVVRDVSERSRADEALRESEMKYRELVENTTYGVFRSTPDGRFLDINPAMVAMLGYDSKEEVLSLNLVSAVYRRPSERDAVLQQYRNEVSSPSGDLCWMKKDGASLLLRTSGRAVRDEAGGVTCYEVIAEDITAQRMLEAELRQAQKMEAVGRLAGGIAHDFNNLLAVILGNVDLLLEPSEPPDKLSYRIEEIRTATVRAAELTQRLLTFSRKQAPDERVFDINEVIQETSKLLCHVLAEDIHVVLKLHSSPQRIRADQAQVEQALMNLAINSRDAMRDGGQLIIETSNFELDSSGSMKQRTVAPGEYVVLTFSDTGCGMDEQTKNQIFEPFFTTKAPGKGTGLGLAMVYSFVRQSRGLIDVYSEVGKGTTFKLYFPKVRTREEAAAVDLPAKIVGGSETVVIAEDEEPLREIVQGILQSLGYTVLSAASGPEALEIVRRSSDRIDLLLTDMIMPGMTGRELAGHVIALRPDVRVVYMSGYAGDVFARHDPRESVDSLLHKPFTRKEIAQRIREAFDHDKRAAMEDRGELQKAPAA